MAVASTAWATATARSIPTQRRQDQSLPWTAYMWERAWQVVMRRTTTAPKSLAELPAFQTIIANLDGAFAAGNVRAFSTATMRLVALCRDFVNIQHLPRWW
ncbi:MAG: hypothetical protein ACT4OO_14085 [Nitrospiraceae bacterium]